VAPIVAIVVFLAIHVLPEKIAEKNHHPQAKAIQCLCLLSLVFGGLLWPLAWLWTYTKPVFHRMAYGPEKPEPPSREDETEELNRLYRRIGELESKLHRPAGPVRKDS